MQMPHDGEPLSVAHWLQDKARDLRDNVYRGREAAWRFDRSLLLQVYNRGVTGQASMVSAEPRNALRLALDIMTRREVRFHALVHDQDADEIDRINDLERLATGIWRGADRTWRQMGNRALLRDLDWFICMGGYAINPLVFRNDRNHTQFMVRVLDPLEVFPEYDDQGTSLVVHRYNTTVKQAKPRLMQRAKESGWEIGALAAKADSDEVEVLNAFWLDETEKGGLGVWNSVVIDGIPVKPAVHEKQFGSRVPIITGPASGHPHRHAVGELGDEWINRPGTLVEWTAAAWEGIFGPARKTYIDLDSLLSYSAEIVRKNALGRYFGNTRDGRPLTTVQQFRDAEIIWGRNGESITPVAPPTSPAERNELLSYLTGSLQRSTLSFTAFGSLGLEISGVTLDSLNNATQSVLSPFLEASQYAVSETMLSLIDQFRDGHFPAIDVEVRGRNESVAERWFIKSFKAADIPKTVLLNAEQQLSLPDTTLARIQAARAAVGDNRQLISEEAIDEHLLPDLVPDYRLNRQRIDADTQRQSPAGQALATVNGMRHIAEQAMARGDMQLAQMALVVAQGVMAQFQQQEAGAQQRVAGINAQRQAQAGAGQRELPPGIQPPEASGVRPEAVDADRLAGNTALSSLLARRSRSVNGA